MRSSLLSTVITGIPEHFRIFPCIWVSPFTFKVRHLDRSMARRAPSITAELAAISLLTQEPMESVQVRGGGLGERAEFQLGFARVDALEALPAASMPRAA